MAPEISQHAPALKTVEAFLNTLDERRFSLRGVQHAGGDGLASPGDLAAWLSGHGMIAAGMRAGPRDLALARALRQALRDLLKLRAAADANEQAACAGTAPANVAGSLPRANDVLDSHLLRVQAVPDGTPLLVPAGQGVPAALAAIAAAAALAQAAGTWKRLKICAAPDCGWVFYDSSRSGAGRWCSMRVCGNRTKTRTYRQRHSDQGRIS